MEIGSIVNGRYLLTGILGKGGMGTVYLAENIKLGTKWAIKCIREETGCSIHIGRIREAEILKKLDHPALPRIFDMFDEEDSICIVADYIEGTNLREYLFSKGIPAEREVMQWLRQLCEVLAYLHSQEPEPVIYRDMKPSNIILTKDNRIKLVDFGIARRYKEENLYDTVFIGTKGYAAPEQYGAGQTDAGTDIYGLGMTLYHMLSGIEPEKLPAEIPLVGSYNKGISAGLEAIIAGCIEKDRKKRYSSAAEVLEDLSCLEAMPKDTGKGKGRDAAASGRIATGQTIKRQVICICGNPDFASEFAYSAANLTKLDATLIDAGFRYQLAARSLGAAGAYGVAFGGTGGLPAANKGYSSLACMIKAGRIRKADMEVCCCRTQAGGRLHILAEPAVLCKRITLHEEKAPDEMELPDEKPDWSVQDCIKEEGAACREVRIRNSGIISGTHDTYSSDAIMAEDAGNIIEQAYRYYDLTVVAMEDDLPDILKQDIFDRSDYIIFAPAADEQSIHCCRLHIERCLRLISDDGGKIKVAVYDYNEGISVPYSVIRKQFSDIGLLGCIKYDQDNERTKNHVGCSSRGRFEKRSGEYVQMLEYFHLPCPECSRSAFKLPGFAIRKFCSMLLRQAYRER